MHENLWVGVGLKVEHARFFLRQMQAALDRPRGQRAAMLEAAGATIDIQWQPAFYANLDAFLVMARSVPEVINSCFGKDTANKEMRNWFAALSPDEQKRRADFLTAFENAYDSFRNLPLSKARKSMFIGRDTRQGSRPASLGLLGSPISAARLNAFLP